MYRGCALSPNDPLKQQCIEVAYANQILSQEILTYLWSDMSKGFNAALPFTSERWRFSPQIMEYNEREGWRSPEELLTC